MPLDHLEPCHTCDATGRDCKKESEGGAGVSGVDFVLYVSSVITEQCLEAVGELQLLLVLLKIKLMLLAVWKEGGRVPTPK